MRLIFGDRKSDESPKRMVLVEAGQEGEILLGVISQKDIRCRRNRAYSLHRDLRSAAYGEGHPLGMRRRENAIGKVFE